MKIIIAATRACNHRPLLEAELQQVGLDYEVKYFEEHPEITEKYHFKTSPTLIVDNKVISVGMPDHATIANLRKKSSKNH